MLVGCGGERIDGVGVGRGRRMVEGVGVVLEGGVGRSSTLLPGLSVSWIAFGTNSVCRSHLA